MLYIGTLLTFYYSTKRTCENVDEYENINAIDIAQNTPN